MNEAAQPSEPRPNWQPPAHGDFARYVEQLTGGQAHVSLDEPGRVARLSERGHAARTALAASDVRGTIDGGPHGASAAALPAMWVHRFAQLSGVRAALSVGLRAVQWGLLLITVVQLALWWAMGLGTLLGVAASLLAWWLVARLKSVLKVAVSTRGLQRRTLAQMRRAKAMRAEDGREQGNFE